MRRVGAFLLVVAVAAALSGAPGCQRMVDVQTGTRTVDGRGNVIAEDIHTVRVPANAAAAYRVVTITRPDAANASAAALYAEAQAAIAAGDLKLAETKLTELLAISPSYPNAKQQHDAIKSGKKVVPDTKPSAPATTTPAPPSTEPTEVAGSLLSWVPAKIAGFSAAKVGVDPLSVSREYLPGAGTHAKSLVIVAEQFRTPAEAKQALQSEVRNRYPSSSSSSQVHGHGTYFGTDGRRFAAIGFASGAVLVAVEASPVSGSPSQMKSLLQSVVGQLP